MKRVLALMILVALIVGWSRKSHAEGSIEWSVNVGSQTRHIPNGSVVLHLGSGNDAVVCVALPAQSDGSRELVCVDQGSECIHSVSARCQAGVQRDQSKAIGMLSLGTWDADGWHTPRMVSLTCENGAYYPEGL
jgi:hypothetical protein